MFRGHNVPPNPLPYLHKTLFKIVPTTDDLLQPGKFLATIFYVRVRFQHSKIKQKPTTDYLLQPSKFLATIFYVQVLFRHCKIKHKKAQILQVHSK